MRVTKSRSKPLTDKEMEARRENAQKSTGPRTEMGKERVRANAVKSGYHADKIAYQAMIALGEDPREYAATYALLYEEMAPQNGGQVLVVEDVAVMRWQQNRNQRGQAGLIGKQLEELTRRRNKQWLSYERTLDDTPQEQVIAHGIACLADSKGKYERIMDLFEIAFEQAQKGKYDDADMVLTIVYGKEKDSMHTVRLRGRIKVLTETPDGPTAKDEKKWLLYELNEERLKWNAAWVELLETMRPPSQAEINACFVPQGKAWRALTRQAASLDQRIDKKMRLYWEMQKKDRERIVRRYEEEKLEAPPEEVAADQEGKAFMEKLMGLIREMDAKLKATAEARQATKAGETEPELTEQAGRNSDKGNTTASTASQKPDCADGVPTGEESSAASAPVSEQSEDLVENKGAGSENKPETELGPVD